MRSSNFNSNYSENFCCFAFQHTQKRTSCCPFATVVVVVVVWLRITAINMYLLLGTLYRWLLHLPIHSPASLCLSLLGEQEKFLLIFWPAFCTLLKHFAQLHIMTTPPSPWPPWFWGNSSDLWQQEEGGGKVSGCGLQLQCVYLIFCVRLLNREWLEKQATSRQEMGAQTER